MAVENKPVLMMQVVVLGDEAAGEDLSEGY